jgi:DNA helicase-2/ATP-dependent DNA helicase PcrA
MFGATATAPWLDELDPEQRRAATHDGGPLLVLAGAGSGKTTTLCARTAHLLTAGVAGERILLLTFTRRAAREMLGRTRALVARSVPGAHRVVGGTFHAVAHRFVRGHAAALGLPPGFSVLDPSDAADVLDLLRDEHGHAQGRRRFPKKATLLDVYSRTVNAQRPLSEVVAEHAPWCDEHREALSALYRAYTARKRAMGAVDFDDLLLLWRALVRDEVLGAGLSDAFAHVLVDEYQDLNGLQVDIVRALRARRRELTAVGDDLQAIYSFRSASVEHILAFAEHFPEGEVVTLERSYRCAQPILDVANALAAQAERAYPRRLRAERDGGTRPRLVFCRDEAAQAAEVCDRVLEAREHGLLLREQAVLMRTTHDSDALELELARRRIPFVKYGGLRYLEAAHVKDLLALMRLVGNPGEEIAWFRLLQLLDGVGPSTARRATAELVSDAAPADRLAAWPRAREHLPRDAREGADALVAALREARGQVRAGVAAERLREALAPLVTARYPDATTRLPDLDGLVAAAAEAGDLERFVAELVLDPPQSSADWAGPPHLDEDWLVLSTVHSAKGLEWGAVHVLAVYDGNFPACLSAGSRESVDEERRLLYVAMTRARRELHLYVPVRYYHRPNGVDDAHGLGKPSRFLTADVQACCEVVRPVETAAPIAATDTRRRIVASVDALFD